MTNHEVNNLIRMLGGGDTAALESLYAAMSKPVYYYALQLCNRPDVAEDVMQETFLAAWENAGSFSADNGRAWLFTIAKNKTLDRLRAESRQATAEDVTDRPDSRAALESAVDELAFWQRLAPLSERERSIVSLRLFSGFTLTEVAEELHIPKGTVFWTYQNAIKKLRKKEEGERS